MIKTSRQLKALVRNKAKGDSAKSQAIIRSYMMERFLERISLSRYKDNVILKGGTLIAAVVGLDNRSTMDMDTTIQNLVLDGESARVMVDEIIAIEIDDGMAFDIKSITSIMGDDEYPGIRITLEATLETMRTPLKVDFSTGDVITPSAVTYSYRLLFEERSISLLAYNLETVLAEKIETIISRGTANTRMRDFYDIHMLTNETLAYKIDAVTFKQAYANTSEKRGSVALLGDADLILKEIADSNDMMDLWVKYQGKYAYAVGIAWDDVVASSVRLIQVVK